MFNRITIGTITALTLSGSAYAGDVTDAWRRVVNGYGLYGASYQLCEHAPPLDPVVDIMETVRGYPRIPFSGVPAALAKQLNDELQRFGDRAECIRSDVVLYKTGLDMQIEDLAAAIAK